MCTKATMIKATLCLIAGLCLPAFVQSAPVAPQPVGMSLDRQPREQIRVLWRGREVAIHHSGLALDKSYIHPLWTPDRRCITYDAPADHLHHRGLCVGWPDVSGIDFWAEVNSPPGRRGRMIPRDVSRILLRDGGVGIAELNDWVDENNRVLVKESREWRFLPPRGNLQIVDVEIVLAANVQVLERREQTVRSGNGHSLTIDRVTSGTPEVVFGSDPKTPREYHGLTIRLGPFEEPKFFNSEGNVGDKNCHGKPARWCALSGRQSGRPVTAAILDHPSNDSHPTRFFVLGAGMQFLSSSPNFSKPKTLRHVPWILQYRVVAAGAPEKKGGSWDLEALWKEFAATQWGARRPPDGTGRRGD